MISLNSHFRVQALAAAIAALLPLLGFADFQVAPNGDDAGDGSPAKPFATLERARDAARAFKTAGNGAGGPVTIWIQPGVYPRKQTFELGAADSGTVAAPVIYRAVKPGETCLQAGRRLRSGDFKPVADPALLQRLDPAARGQVVQFDLGAIGLKNIKPFPMLFSDGGGLGELFFNGRRMPLARWPNDGDTTMAKVLDRGDWTNGPNRHGGRFIANEDRVARWQVDHGVWLEGYWRVPWEISAVRVKAINPATREITFAEPVAGGIGSKYAKPGTLGDGKEPWHAINLPEEIDRPGEWCLDFDSRTIYFWPPGDLAQATVSFNDFEKPLIVLKDCGHIMLRGLVMEGGLGNGIEIRGGTGNLVAGCTIRNLGGNGVMVLDGQDNGVRSCDLHELGQSGILLTGGDRKTLTPCGNFAENNHLYHLGIRRKTYAAAIHVGAYGAGEAIGCRVAHNLIHDLPHAGILYGGNENLFEYNEICRVALTSGDVGVFYTWNDWTSRGNILRHNFVYNSPRANAFYMDDGDSGDTVYGNVIYRTKYGPFIGGGHDNVIQNNIVIEAERGVHLDSRGVSRGYATNAGMIKRLAAMNVTMPPWSTRYPALATLQTSHPGLPTSNLIENNVAVDCKQPLSLSGKPDELKFSKAQTPLKITIAEAGFEDAAHLNFQLKTGSPIFQNLPGFKPVPFAQIGLQRDEFRDRIPARENHLAEAGGKEVFDSSTDVQQSNRLEKRK